MSARRMVMAGLLLALAGCATPSDMTLEDREAVAVWQRSVRVAIAAKSYFPRDPSRALSQMSGVTTIRFLVGERGAIYTPQIQRGSGEPLFDAAALTIVLSAAPLPPPPPVLLRDKPYVEMVAPINFELRQP
jgi:TonB family protein